MNRPRLIVPMGRLSPLDLIVMIGAVALSACEGPPPTGQSQADAATRAACQARAEQAYTEQNRAQIYGPQSQVNTPYSASYNPDSVSRGLSDLFVHDRMISDCIRNTGSAADRSLPAATTPEQ
jgi:hypothetical protein